MAAYTASVSGNWSSTATWGGAGPPAAGDTVTISNAIAVTVDSNVTVGSAPGQYSGSQTSAITMGGATASLTIAAGVTLTCRGDITLVGVYTGNSTAVDQLILNAGATLTMDASTSAAGTIYQIFTGTGLGQNCRIKCNGTSASPCLIQANPPGGATIGTYKGAGLGTGNGDTNYTSTYSNWSQPGGIIANFTRFYGLGRRASTVALGSGTANNTGSTTTTTLINDSTKAWTVNAFAGYTLINTTRGFTAVITSNTATTITLSTSIPNQVSGDTYNVVVGGNADVRSFGWTNPAYQQFFDCIFDTCGPVTNEISQAAYAYYDFQRCVWKNSQHVYGNANAQYQTCLSPGFYTGGSLTGSQTVLDCYFDQGMYVGTMSTNLNFQRNVIVGKNWYNYPPLVTLGQANTTNFYDNWIFGNLLAITAPTINGGLYYYKSTDLTGAAFSNTNSHGPLLSQYCDGVFNAIFFSDDLSATLGNSSPGDMLFPYKGSLSTYTPPSGKTVIKGNIVLPNAAGSLIGKLISPLGIDGAVCKNQSRASAGALTLNGTSTSAGTYTAPTANNIYVTSAGNDSGITFSIVGTSDGTTAASETLAGSNAGVATSVNVYKTITSITTSGATASVVAVCDASTGGDGKTNLIGKLYAEHNTVFAQKSPSGYTVTESGVAAYGEGGNCFPNFYASVQSNLCWSNSSTYPACVIAEQTGTSTAINPVNPSNAGHNGFWNPATGTSDGALDKNGYVCADGLTHFTPVGNLGISDVTVSSNPFVDSTRTPLTYDTAQGGSGTTLSLIANMQAARDWSGTAKPQYTPVNIYNWIRNGFLINTSVAPTLLNAGHDSVTIGAMPAAPAKQPPTYGPQGWLRTLIDM